MHCGVRVRVCRELPLPTLLLLYLVSAINEVIQAFWEGMFQNLGATQKKMHSQVPHFRQWRHPDQRTLEYNPRI